MNRSQVFLVFLVFLAFAIPSFSQVSSGTLLGDAHDEKAASVAAVDIDGHAVAHAATTFARAAWPHTS